jgi:gatB/yqey family protein
MAYSVEKWERTRAYFESGQYTLSQISEKVGISKSKISERAKKEQWERGKNADYIEAKKTIAATKGNEKRMTVAILDEIADEKTKHLLYFQNAALRNQKIADEMLEMSDKIADVEAHSRITARNKETIFGKEPQTIINNTNAQQNEVTEIRRTIVKLDK